MVIDIPFVVHRGHVFLLLPLLGTYTGSSHSAHLLSSISNGILDGVLHQRWRFSRSGHTWIMRRISGLVVTFLGLRGSEQIATIQRSLLGARQVPASCHDMTMHLS